MQLSQYLKEAKLTPGSFARQIGRHRSTVLRIVKGDFKPDLKTMERIIAATDGAVTPNDFFNLPKRARQ